MRQCFVLAILISAIFAIHKNAHAVETAPSLSDREIIERLTRLEEVERALERRIDMLEENMNKRFDDMNKRFDDMNKRFDILMWMIGLFVSIVSVILGFVIRIQWQMNKRLSSVEATLVVQRDEISFLKGIIEKLITTKGS